MFENHFSPSPLPSPLLPFLALALLAHSFYIVRLPLLFFVIVAKMVSKTDTEGERATANSFSGSPLRLAGWLAREGHLSHAKPFFFIQERSRDGWTGNHFPSRNPPYSYLSARELGSALSRIISRPWTGHCLVSLLLLVVSLISVLFILVVRRPLPCHHSVAAAAMADGNVANVSE